MSEAPCNFKLPGNLSGPVGKTLGKNTPPCNGLQGAGGTICSQSNQEHLDEPLLFKKSAPKMCITQFTGPTKSTPGQ